MNITIKGTDSDGKEYTLPYPFWLTFESDIDAPADALTLTYLNQDLPEICMITVTGDIYFDGIIDLISRKKSQDGDKTVLNARSLAAILLDSEASPGEHTDLSLDMVYWDFYCLGKIKGFLYDTFTPVSSITLPKGTSKWRFLTLFCEQTMGNKPRITDDGYISTKPYSTEILHNFSESDCIAVEKTTDLSDIINSVSARNQNGVYSTSVVSTAVTPFQRVRYLIPGAKWVNFEVQYCKKILRQSMLRHKTITATLPKLHAAHVGDGVMFDGEEKCVIGVKYTLNSNGAATELILGERKYI